MNKIKYLIFFSLFANAGCATERLYVDIVDDEGRPVANANVEVSFLKSSFLLYGGSSSSSDEYNYDNGKSNYDGKAVVRFNCTSSHFDWYVHADGYYQSDTQREGFKFYEIILPPGIGSFILLEHVKHGKAMLYRKKNPQPMYAYTHDMGVRSPIENGRYGFDLECFDWLPPIGNGKVADFYYVRERPDVKNMGVKKRAGRSGYFTFKKNEVGYPKLNDVIGRIEFMGKDGAYIAKKNKCKSFQGAYSAGLNQKFMQNFSIVVAPKDEYGVWLMEGYIVEEDEYMVIRSRTKLNDKGEIVSANYSKILGPFSLSQFVYVLQSTFNPCINDTNLEFDPDKNLYKGDKGRGKLP